MVFFRVCHFILLHGYFGLCRPPANAHTLPICNAQPLQVIQLVTDGDQQVKEFDFLLLDYKGSPEETVESNDTGLDFSFWKEKIQFQLEKKCLYENPDLTLTLLSKHLKTNASVVSKVVNYSFGQNFNDFANSFRVAAVKTAIHHGEYKQT